MNLDRLMEWQIENKVKGATNVRKNTKKSVPKSRKIKKHLRKEQMIVIRGGIADTSSTVSPGRKLLSDSKF